MMDTFEVMPICIDALLPMDCQVLKGGAELGDWNVAQHPCHLILKILKSGKSVPPQNLFQAWEQPKV